MEIIVQGTGSEYFTPNEVILNINFYAKENTYEEALNNGIRNVEIFINEVLLKNGFNKDDMKTRSFTVREDKRYNEITRNYEFNGYLFNQSAKVKFDYDKSRIATIMVALSKLDNSPDCQINFGIKNEKECRRHILEKAYKDAEDQAQAIALASSKTLKQCMKVDFQPFTTTYISHTRMDSDLMYSEKSIKGAAKAITNSFTPEDIELTETLYCLWIAE